MDAPENRVKLVQAESDRLTQDLHALPPEAWSRPSACDRWEVRDVVAHLVGGAELYAGTVSRGLQGDIAPPQGRPPAGTGNTAVVAAGSAQGAISKRERLGDQLFATFKATNDQLNHLFAGLEAHDWDTPCYHPTGVKPVRAFVNLRISELAIHGWDIRSTLASSAQLSDESIPVLMELIPKLVGWTFRSGAKLATPARYRFEVTGTAPSACDIIVAGDTARLEPAGEAEAQVTCRCDTETFVLLMYGRLTLDRAITTGRGIWLGAPELIAAFDRWFKGV